MRIVNKYKLIQFIAKVCFGILFLLYLIFSLLSCSETNQKAYTCDILVVAQDSSYIDVHQTQTDFGDIWCDEVAGTFRRDTSDNLMCECYLN